MASLQEIKSRLTSVQTTKKITKAMQLVATAKLKKARSGLEETQEYTQAVMDAFKDLLSNLKGNAKVLDLPKMEDSILYIVITSDLGLCGAYNSNIIKLAKENIRAQDKILVVGSKGASFFKANGIKPELEFDNIGDAPNYVIANVMTEEILAHLLTGKVNGIRMLHTEFINTVTFNAKMTQIFPAEGLKKEISETEKTTAQTEFEPNVETVIRNALPLYVSALLFGAMVESKVSEMSSRRSAMENATDNADELIETLDLQYNRARQAEITQEITEIVAGSNTN